MSVRFLLSMWARNLPTFWQFVNDSSSSAQHQAILSIFWASRAVNDQGANSPLTRSILFNAPSSRSNLFLFSASRFSRTSTRSSNLALAFRSVATIVFACSKSVWLRSSSSPLICVTCPSALCRKSCSRASAAWRSDSRREDGGRLSLLLLLPDCRLAPSREVRRPWRLVGSLAGGVGRGPVGGGCGDCCDFSWRSSSS
jgi:hypothetical protein